MFAAKLLIAMKSSTPKDYRGPILEIITRDMKNEQIPDFVKRVMDAIPPTVTKFGSFQKDQIDGDLTKTVFEYLIQKQATMVEMSTFIDEAFRVKLDCEQKNMRIAGKFTEWTFKKIADDVEGIIEDDKKVKHSHI